MVRSGVRGSREMLQESKAVMACESGLLGIMGRTSRGRESRDTRKRHRRGKKRHTGRSVTTTAPSAAATGAIPIPAAAMAAVNPLHLPDLHLSKSGGERGTDDEDDSFESESESFILRSLSDTPHRLRVAGFVQPSLRPVIVPKAPENSTQFLIDDHENSSLFLNFEDSYKSPSLYQPVDDVEPFSSSRSSLEVTDEESLSDMYYMRDFESEYQSAKEEVLLNWSRDMLFTEIQKLELKARGLEELLNLRDPHKYLVRLQEQLLFLQEENKQLQDALKRSDHSSSVPTSDEDVVPFRRERADTASDLVMVVAPLSITDASSTIESPPLPIEMETS